jgi:hypothetical protein
MYAYRSSMRLFAVGVIGLILIVAALDIMFFHWLSTPPDGADSVLTTRGQAQQRGDMLWGASLIGIGVILFGTSLIELVRRKPVVDVRDDGLHAEIGAQAPDVLIPWSAVDSVSSTIVVDPYDGSTREQLVVRLVWSAVDSVSSTIVVDPYDGSTREQLVVRLVAPEAVPHALAGAVLNGNELHIDAHDWNRPVTDVALAAQGARDHAMRLQVAVTPETSPAGMWETRVDLPTEEMPVTDLESDGEGTP